MVGVGFLNFEVMVVVVINWVSCWGGCLVCVFELVNYLGL